MRTLRKSFLLAAMAAALPYYMSDETASAAPIEDPNAGASAADVSQESGTMPSATTATNASDTGATAEAAGDAGNAVADAAASGGATESAVASSADAPAPTAAASTAPTNDDTGKVEIAADSHAEAKDRFAGLLARMHQFEHEAIDELRADLVAIGTLLHLHSKAATTAQTTGDYKAADLS